MNERKPLEEKSYEVNIKLTRAEYKQLQMMIDEIRHDQNFMEAFRSPFIETKVDDENPWRSAAQVITHLFKIKFCSKDTYRNKWRKDIIHHREAAKRILLWDDKEKRRNDLISQMESKIGAIYGMALHFYGLAAKNFPDLPLDGKLFPERCLWTLTQLMEDNVDSLLRMIEGAE
jgi:hypothetical protein